MAPVFADLCRGRAKAPGFVHTVEAPSKDPGDIDGDKVGTCVGVVPETGLLFQVIVRLPLTMINS